MSKFFKYVRKEKSPVQVEGKEENWDEFLDVINTDNIIRAVKLQSGHLLILMNDIHDRTQDAPMYNKKGERTGTKKETLTVQSEIYLTEANDIERFYNLAE